MDYLSMSKQKLIEQRKTLQKLYDDFKKENLSLDMSRGKPGTAQLEISSDMLDVLNKKSNYTAQNGVDYRNYGLLEGIPEIRELFAEMLGVKAQNVIAGGNSSLNMMFDVVSCFMTHGVCGNEPWIKQGNVKFLCPVPGYDRHFSICEYYNIEMIEVNMLDDGPDMDEIELLVQSDEKIKGIWCVPKYSNPQGITYSDEVVRRFAKLKPLAKDFRIFWDNAYAVHDITDTPDKLLNIMDECIKNKNEDLVIEFCSTSKITFPGSGVAALAASENNLKEIKKRYFIQTIGYDKLNQLRHIHFFKDYNGVLNHMKKHKDILRPKFNKVLEILEREFSHNKIVSWIKPNGGYFISIEVHPKCAKKVVELCKEAGLVLTPAGATYPYKRDIKDSNIRIAPTYPTVEELEKAMNLLCVCIKLAALDEIISEK